MKPNTEAIIARWPPSDGRDWDSQCARCGSSTMLVECEACDGNGCTEPGELYEEDPIWYDVEDVERCCFCGGRGRWQVCISSSEWCEAHPAPGREIVPATVTIEWFTLDPKRRSA